MALRLLRSISQRKGIAMSVEHSSSRPLAGGISDRETPEARRETIRTVRWALVIACAYLVLFSNQTSQSFGIGGIVVALFLASNLVLGRIPARIVGTPQFNVGLALTDAVLIGASLYFAAQLSVELVVLCLGVLVLAIAGLSPGAIALGTVAMAMCYLIIVWAAGTEPLWRSSILLRGPFLLSAAIVYAWLVDAGRKSRAEPGASMLASDLAAMLAVQRDAIRRCQMALAEGGGPAAQSVLSEIAAENHDMAAKLGRLEPALPTDEPGHPAAAVAHSPA
jgi:hypothetical protein